MAFTKKEQTENIINEKFDNSDLKKKSVKKEKTIKKETIILKISKEDKELLQQYADSKGSNISNEVRRLVLSLLTKEGLK